MFIKALSLTGLALLIAASAALPASNAPAASKASPQTSYIQTSYVQPSYIKPGAAIEIRYDYDGQTAIGEAETITLEISHMYSAGYLTAALMPDYGLTIITDVSEQSHSLQSGSVITLPVQLSAAQAGHYSLGVEIVYESLAGHQSRRVVSVPLTIGAAPLPKAQQKPGAASFKSESQRTDSADVIGMAARESIR